MARTKNVNGVAIPLTASEETARDAEEAAWTAATADRATLAAEPNLLELIEAVIEQTPAPPNSALEDVKVRLEAAKQVRGRS